MLGKQLNKCQKHQFSIQQQDNNKIATRAQINL